MPIFSLYSQHPHAYFKLFSTDKGGVQVIARFKGWD